MTTSPTFIPGYQATVTLMSEDISAIGSVVSLEKTRNVMTKPTFGNPWGNSLGGQRLGAFSASGHVSAEQAAALEGMFDSDTPVDFTLQVGEGGGATDAGVHTGKCVVSSYRIEANADDEWNWSIEAQTDGPVTYTPVVGP